MSIGAAAGRSVHVGLRSYRPLPVSRRFCSSDPTPSRDKPTQRSTFRPKPSSTHDWIGPPNPLSNLRPIVYHIPEKESDLEKRLRMLRQETEDWNHEFWTKQNISFSKEKEAFIISHLKAKGLTLRDEDGEASHTYVLVFFTQQRNETENGVRTVKMLNEIHFVSVCSAQEDGGP
uniref:Cytochrome c oxidase assembly factor 8 n=1 Tax=Nothobranchius furzeri TaxID=105023 RepID=A0A8C6LRR5_NOTFU